MNVLELCNLNMFSKIKVYYTTLLASGQERSTLFEVQLFLPVDAAAIGGHTRLSLLSILS